MNSIGTSAFASPNFVRYFKPALCCIQLGRIPRNERCSNTGGMVLLARTWVLDVLVFLDLSGVSSLENGGVAHGSTIYHILPLWRSCHADGHAKYARQNAQRLSRKDSKGTFLPWYKHLSISYDHTEHLIAVKRQLTVSQYCGLLSSFGKCFGRSMTQHFHLTLHPLCFNQNGFFT